MKVNGKLEWTDYLEAQKLHMRRSGWRRWLLYAVAAFLILGFVLVLISSLQDQDWASLGLISWPLIAGGVFLLYSYVVIPRRVRQLYSQHKEMSAPFEHEITPAALITTTQFGTGNRPWNIFHKWKENDKIFLVYTSDLQFVLIPKRFCTPEQLDALRARLRENKVREVK
jgi:YcxB-like protein